MKKIIAIAAGAALTASMASAQEAEEAEVDVLTHMSLTSGESLDGAMAETLDQGQINMLKSVAHQQVVAMKCAGFEVDQARYRTEMNRIHINSDGTEADLTPEQLHNREKIAMMGFGMAIGSQIAIAAYDHDAFCAHAEEERAAEDQSHIIWAAAGE